MLGEFRIGCAGWAIPKSHAARFPASGTHLARYAARLDAVEINSSFHRPHRKETYERWAASVPAGFRFAVKAPREITHTRRLLDAEDALDDFLSQVAGLGAKLGPLLFQLPPSLAFESAQARAFLDALRARFEGLAALEPRHASWFGAQSEELLVRLRISRVAADPPVTGGALAPGGWAGLAYFRLHGAPRIYYSEYDTRALEKLAKTLAEARDADRGVWCIFDNSASGAATINALSLRACLEGIDAGSAQRPKRKA